MKRILVPTDFSPTAEKAFRFAVDIAAKAKGTVILYHSYIPLGSIFIGTEETRKQENSQTEADLLKRLQRLEKEVTQNGPEVHVSTVVGHAPLLNMMLEFAVQNHIDLIVMGTQGASGLKRTVIGSVAAGIIEKSELPLLLVPAQYELGDPDKFVFAANRRESDTHALKLVNALAQLYQAQITVLHFLSADTAEKEKERKDFDAYVLSMQKLFNKSNIKFQLLETYSVIEAMETLDEIFPYDIMALVRRKKTFLEKFFIESITQNMAYVTTKPLLIVPEAE